MVTASPLVPSGQRRTAVLRGLTHTAVNALGSRCLTPVCSPSRRWPNAPLHDWQQCGARREPAWAGGEKHPAVRGHARGVTANALLGEAALHYSNGKVPIMHDAVARRWES